VQFAAAHGARVIVTSSRDDKLARVLAMGASDGINRTKHPEWQRVVLKLTDGRGSDHILEMAGGDNLARSLEAIRFPVVMEKIWNMCDIFAKSPGKPIASISYGDPQTDVYMGPVVSERQWNRNQLVSSYPKI